MLCPQLGGQRASLAAQYHESVDRRSLGLISRAALPLALCFTMTLLPGCGTQRSVAAFCDVYVKQKQTYLAKYNAVQDDISKEQDALTAALKGLSGSMAAMGDAARIFDALDKVAPDDVEPDVAALRDYFQKMVDSAGGSVKDPAGTLLGNLVGGLAVQGSWDRVGKYVQKNCHTN
jgi:hypothetical protein